ISRTQANSVSIYSGNGDGTFQAAITVDVVPDASWFSWNYTSLAVADLNADGTDEFFLIGGAYRTREDAIFGSNGITVFSLFSRSSDGSFSKRVYSIGNNAGDFLPYTSALIGDLTSGGPAGILVLTPYASSSAVLVPSITFTTTAANAFFTPGGTHGVKAVYPGDTNYAAITSSTTNVQGSSAQTTLTLSVTPTSSGYDDPVDVTITATPCSVSGQSCTGNLVTLYDGATNVGTYHPTSAGVVHFTSRSFSQGTHVLSATFAGNTYFSSATSNTVTLTVGPPARIIGTLSLSMNYGTPDNYTLEADLAVPSVNGTPTGNVSFIDTSNNNAVIGTATFNAFTPKLQTANTTQLGAVETQILYAADLDGDGKQDLLSIDGSPTVLHGNGDGTFTGSLSTSGWSTYPYAVAKFNSDQILDVVVANQNSITVFLGTGAGTFVPLPPISDSSDMVSPILAGDFNGDGKQDLYNGTTEKVFFGNGDGTFQSGVATSIVAQLAGDFNGDGRTDLFGPNGVFLGKADGTFTTVSAPSAYVTGSLTADFNGDGKLDVFTTGNALMLGNGDGSFQAPIAVDLDAGVSNPLGHPRYFTGDFNGDGKRDVGVVLDVPGTFSYAYSYLVVTYGDGTGHFTNKNVTAPMSSFGATLLNAIPPYLPDFNGDGASDVVAFQENVPDPAGSNTSIVLYSAHNVASAIATGLSVSAPPSGNHTVIASYPGDANYMDVTSTSSVLLGARDAATLTLSVNPNPVDYGSQVSLTATLSPYDNNHPTDSESIDFYDGSSYITTGILSQGTATVTTTGLLPGARLITAKYSGDGYLKPTTSTPVTVNVNHAPVLITWSPGAISYGMPLSSTQLNATTTAQGTLNTPVPGTFTYSPAAGTILDVGQHLLSATFTPTDNVTYNVTSAQAVVTVNKATPTLAVTQASPVSPGTSIGSSTTLKATATTAYGTPNGVVVFYDGATQIASALLTNGIATASVTFSTTGNHSITATYQGDNNFNAITSPVFIEAVGKGIPTITWPTPAAITYGTALSATQLNATTTVAGSFAYTPAASTILNAGSQTLSTTFTPTDTVNYNGANGSTTLVVNKATPSATVTQTSSATPSVGTSVTLQATIAVGYGIPTGTVTFYDGTTSIGTRTLTSGSAALTTSFSTAGTHLITVIYAGDTNFNSATSSPFSEAVAKVTPSITWATPPAITYGIALSATQLNATSSVAGAFAYSPAAGAVLNAGSQTLSTTFTPIDTANYNNASGSTTLVVEKATPSITIAQTSPITIGVGTGVATSFRANLAASYGTPSGTVGFYEGTTLLGTGTLINGTTSVTTTFSSTGVHTITALYIGDANFNSVTSAAFNETVVLFGIGLAANPTTLTIKQGQSGTATITATPTGNYTGTLTFSCGNLPSSVSCSFAPATLAFNGDNQPQSTTITVSTRTTSAALMTSSGLRLASLL
ncbi:MAG TPA: Ig-like domain repeat protein, partial [Bryobacteraceae bacterium]